jgi:hypothetical protein
MVKAGGRPPHIEGHLAMLRVIKRALLVCALAVSALSAGAYPLLANAFVFDETVNDEMARRLAIPVYFGLPESARARLPRTTDTSDRLIDFRHPAALKSNANVGLRLIVAKRDGLARRLAQSGLVQTGDILLAFRPEWGGAGAYPNVQMGISHTGVAYVKDGTVHNIDNPLDDEFIGEGRLTELNSQFYRSINLVHVIRPRSLTDHQRTNIVEWATRLNAAAERIFPDQIDFNQDYNDPKYKPGKPLSFVKRLGQIALGQKPRGKIDMYCSEFAWSLLALRNCDPDDNVNAFRSRSMPVCVTPVMQPMHATGTYVGGESRNAYTGLADGPLLVVSSLNLPREERDRLLQSIFVADPAGMAKMSEGHRDIAKKMQDRFAKLESYYQSAASGAWLGLKARLISSAISKAIPANYSPASYLVNTLLPPDNANRTMDYVATIVME